MVLKSTFVLLCFIIAALGIINNEDPVTKPPIHRENLPWPSRPSYGAAPGVKSSPGGGRGEWSGPTQQRTKSFTPSERQRLNDRQMAPVPNLSPLSNKQVLCPHKATGQFPYAPNCRRFINCFKGRGQVQVCPPGTLFNPMTLECDFPDKVNCLDSKSQYKVQPGLQQQQLEENSHALRRPERMSSPQNEDWKRGFKSYKVTQPPPTHPQPQTSFNGHGGVQPPVGALYPNYFGQPLPSPMLQPPPPPPPIYIGPLPPPPPPMHMGPPPPMHMGPPPPMHMGPPPPMHMGPPPRPMGRPLVEPTHQGSPFNIPPIMSGGSRPNTNSSNPVDSYGKPNPGYYIVYRIPQFSPQGAYFPQNHPGYPIPVGSTPRKPLHSGTNPPPLFTGPVPGYPQNQPERDQPQSPPLPSSVLPTNNPPYNPQIGQYPSNPVPQGGQSYPQNRPYYPTDSGKSPRFPDSLPPNNPPVGQTQNPSGYSGYPNVPSYSPQQHPQPQPGVNPSFEPPSYGQPQNPGSHSGYPNRQGYPQGFNPIRSQPQNPNSYFPNGHARPQNGQPQHHYPNGVQTPNYQQRNPQNAPQYPESSSNEPPTGRDPVNTKRPSQYPGSDTQTGPSNQPQYPPGYVPLHPQNSQPESQPSSGGRPSVHVVYPETVPSQNPQDQLSQGYPQNPYNPSATSQSPVGTNNQPQGSYPVSQPRYPQNHPQFNPKNNPQPDYPPYDQPESPQNEHSGYNPQVNSDPRGFGNPQVNPQGPPTGYPQRREPEIFPQGGQPGYFLPNAKDNEPDVKRPPPRYNPVDPSKQSVKCPQGARGLFPHPYDCFKFLSCDHGRTHIMDCAPGTAFNPLLSNCDFPHNVDCGTSTDPQPDSNKEAGGTDDSNSPWQPSTDSPLGDIDYGEDEDPSPSELVEVLDVRGNQKADQGQGQGLVADLEPQVTTARTTTTSTARTTTARTTTTSTTTQPTRKQPPTFPPYPVPPTDIHPEEETYIEAPLKTPPRTPKKNIATRNEPPPISKQLARLRGGSKANEGFLEMRGLKEWGMVCDKHGEWTMAEANIVCKQLGYERGAELTWQGRPSDGEVATKRSVAFSSVWCNGNETNILDCTTKNDMKCQPERDAVWIRCHENPQSLCQPGEASYKGRCYHLVVPREDAKIDSIGFSQGEALAHCQIRRGRLLDITSQEESDFVSEWLVSQNMTSNIMTSGVGVSVMGSSIWIWEGSPDTFKYSNWWPGWNSEDASFPGTKSNRALCVIARRYFPCPSENTKSTAETSFCDAEYFFWDIEDCAIMSNKHPYICERDGDDVGCVKGTGNDYSGRANVTETSTACLPWESPKVFNALKYRVSQTTFKSTLAGHNYCRNIAGSETHPWCYVQAGDAIKKEACDIPICVDHSAVITAERTAGEASYTCGPNLFACELNECIPSAWVCDGQPDCRNNYDELNCTGGLSQFSQQSKARLMHHDKEKWLHTSAANCATRCLETTQFVCRSFSYFAKDQICLLSDSNVGLSGQLSSNQTEWEYYERTSHSIDCSNKILCGNGKCINKTSGCDGKNDCGDRSDEKNCSAVNLGYEIRLGGSSNRHEGRIEVKVLGQWGYVCDDKFDMRDAEVVCRELGFTLGAAEIRPHSAFVPLNTSKPVFLVDDLECRGNETSVRECDFGGWGVHDCGPEEVVGVVCKIPEAMCANKFWQCSGRGECIPVGFLCDNIPDCDDGSDENPQQCKEPVAVRLVKKDGSRSMSNREGRLEVKKFGVWGTVCDDDFGEAEAQVVCRHLGYKGPAKARKEAAFGVGEGLIWLDGVHCSGNETSIEKCIHDHWGSTDCQHQEDVAVICSDAGANYLSAQKPLVDVDVNNNFPTDDIVPEDCGTIDEEIKYLIPEMSAKVVNGQEVIHGKIPWQASLRVRTSLKSVHWCGAVILTPLHILTSAHCLVDYTKSAYFVRVGDFDSEVPEGTEQEHDIDSTYIHEDFDKGQHLSNDLALIKLKGAGLRFTKHVRAVCLPPSITSYSPGANCTISGWGSSGSPGAGYSRRLKTTSVPIIAEYECRAPYVYGDALSEGMFCAGDLRGGSDSCQGDSGGPFVCTDNDRAVLYGVTSWGHGCGRPNKPGVYTKVAKYINWIHTKIHDSLTGK